VSISKRRMPIGEKREQKRTKDEDPTDTSRKEKMPGGSKHTGPNSTIKGKKKEKQEKKWLSGKGADGKKLVGAHDRRSS